MMNRHACVSALLMLAVGLARLPQVSADDGLVGQWQLDRAHVRDGAVTPLIGAWSGRLQGQAGFDERAPSVLRFDGPEDAHGCVRVSLPADRASLPSEQIAVEAWVCIEAPQEWGGIIGCIQDDGDVERGWLLGYKQSQFCFAVSTKQAGRLTYLTAADHWEPGEWYHVAGTFDGVTQRIYVDGRLQAEANDQSGELLWPDTDEITLAAYRDANEHYTIQGRIERAALWKRALSADEVMARFDALKRGFPGAVPVRDAVEGWPTYLRDTQRTGISDETLSFPLRLEWVHIPRQPPAPAWPAPAAQDFWHKKFKLKARVVYDRAFHPVVNAGRVYFASSADDQVRCVDASNGQELWTFFAEAPVRLAPTVAGERILFGADDGCAYCLHADDGRMLWSTRVVPTDRRVPGNGRLISVWPIRTGLLVEDNVAYCCAGMFPEQGVRQAALDVVTGRELASGAIDISAQGYLERRSGRLYVPTGRDPAGAFVTQLTRRGKGVAKELKRIPNDYPYAFIGARGVRFGGGDGRVAAFSDEDGRLLWSAEVEGIAYGMAIAQGRLYVSTDRGKLYAFGPASSNVDTKIVEADAESPFPFANEMQARDAAETARRILLQSGAARGYCLVLGSGDGALVYELARQSDLQVVGVERSDALVAASRRALSAAGLYGRAVVHHLDPSKSLPYTDYIFNLVVSGALMAPTASSTEQSLPSTEFVGERPVVSATLPPTFENGDASRREIWRVLRPSGGVAMLGWTSAAQISRGPLPDAGEWTHMYADASNTTCSADRLVSGELALQWFGPPGPAEMLDRHHRTVAPVWKNGRLFIPGNNRVIAVDAYNGTVLWNREMPQSRRIGAYRDCSYLVAADDVLYVAAGNGVVELDAATGAERRRVEVAAGEDQSPREWGYLASVGDLLFGTAVKPGASRRGHSLEAINEGTFWDSRPLVGSDRIFVFDRSDGSERWSYEPRAGLIVNPTLTVGDGRVYFVESRNPETRKQPHGRATPEELLKDGANLVALDALSGSVLWSHEIDLSRIEHNLYVTFAKDKLVVVGSRNSGTDREQATVLYDVNVFEAANGRPVWSHTQDQGTGINGDHGEQDHHPVVVGEKLYCEPFGYDLHTGKPLQDFAWLRKHRRGCGNIAASADSFFFRNHNPMMFDLSENVYRPVTKSTRPGCWINMIPAGGLLLIPEASSGCTCDFAIQTSLAFLPRHPERAQSSGP